MYIITVLNPSTRENCRVKLKANTRLACDRGRAETKCLILQKSCRYTIDYMLTLGLARDECKPNKTV